MEEYVLDTTKAELIKAFQADFNQKKADFPDATNVAKLPIIWFGNEAKYQASSKKIVTIAVNPSDVEFVEESKDGENETPISPSRFPSDINLEDSLNTYFEDPEHKREEGSNPYLNWFKNLEKELKYFDASYFGSQPADNQIKNWSAQPNRAIHIDFESAIATTKKWSKVNPIQQSLISNHDNFNLLFDYLKPHFAILYSRLPVFDEFVRTVNNGKHIQPKFILNKSGEVVEPTENNTKDINVGIITKDDVKNTTGINLIWVKNSRNTNRCYGDRIQKFLKNHPDK